jgi:hypothetical protein
MLQLYDGIQEMQSTHQMSCTVLAGTSQLVFPAVWFCPAFQVPQFPHGIIHLGYPTWYRQRSRRPSAVGPVWDDPYGTSQLVSSAVSRYDIVVLHHVILRPETPRRSRHWREGLKRGLTISFGFSLFLSSFPFFVPCI